ncbi:MAG: hypothetical protein F4X98_08930 [Gammaproteobacteria bacterium]|nr:hypothetical protein [Gammaproteobacteria bacterium]
MAKPMSTDQRERLARIRSFDQLVVYLHDELGWPIDSDDFENVTFDYTPEELGIDAKNAAKIQEIKRLRPLVTDQPWGIFFVKFEPKRLPVVALRRILGQVAIKKRASANKSERQAWATDDLLFVSNYGEGDERRITFAHFSKPKDSRDLPTLKVLGWDNLDTPLHLDLVASELAAHLAWPDDHDDRADWRKRWGDAFKLGHREVINTSKQLSERLAKLACAIRDRIQSALDIETESGPLTKLMKAFRSALVHDLDEAGFADMYAQTITYGLLSARITDPVRRTADDLAAHMRTNPFLKELMETFLHAGGRRGQAGGRGIDFDELGIAEVVELLDGAHMEAVVRDFGDRNPLEDPVIHFYEHFLAAYDKEQKVSRGVFYTPRSVVSYIVRSVDELLRLEFGLADGLADTTTWGEMAKRHKLKIPLGVSPNLPFVQILDPATGTGTFLVEVIDVVQETMVAQWKAQGYRGKEIDTLWNDYVPRNLLPRLHGYELLMAPYAIAHLKIGLKLFETGYRFESEERARVYLTNALEPPGDDQRMLDFLPALAHEAEAVNEIKRKQKFTVVIGNPPYSGLSANMGSWIDGLLKGRLLDVAGKASYYHVDGEPLGERKVWLQDDYVKFVRLSQWLLDGSGAGVHGYICNHGYLDNPTFRGMRRSLMQSFEQIRVLDLHGNLKKKEIPPDRGRDANVFDIQQGVAIGLFTKSAPAARCVCHADLWGEREQKYRWLMGHNCADTRWNELMPALPFCVFEPYDDTTTGTYYGWPGINEVMAVNVTGIVTARDKFVIDMDRHTLRDRVWDLRSKSLSDDEIRSKYFLGKGSRKYPPGDSRGWKLHLARRKIREDDRWDDRYAPVLYRPFDEREVYYVPWMVDWPRTETMPHMLAGENVSLGVTRAVEVGDGFSHVFASRAMIQHHTVSLKEVNYQLPLYLYPMVGKADSSLFSRWPRGKNGRSPNLDSMFVEEIATATELRFVSDGVGDLQGTFGPEDVLAWVYAVFHSPRYRELYDAHLKLDFPRVPVPTGRELFTRMTESGHELLLLHVLESVKLNEFITAYAGPPNAAVDRVGWSSGTVWLDAGKTNAREDHLATKPGTIGFQGVPELVWRFRIGGYQICHKWLSDRKGRTLSDDDSAHYQKIIVALNETIRTMAEIDDAIEDYGGWPNAFKAMAAEERPVALMAAEPSPSYVVDAKNPRPTYARSLPDIARSLRAAGIRVPEDRQFTELDREGQSCAIWCVLYGEGSLSQDESTVKLCASRLRHSGWVDYQRLGPRSDLYREIDETLRRATRQGNGWLDKPANLHVRAYCRFSDMAREDWRDCVLKVMSWYDAAVERDAVIREAFDDARERFGIERTNLVKAVEGPIRSAINSCIRKGYVMREGPDRLVMLARYSDPS